MPTLQFPNIEAVREFERAITSDPRNFAHCVQHVRAAPNAREDHLRYLALRAACKARPPHWEPTDLASRQALRFLTYRTELSRVRTRYRKVEEHRRKLACRGTAPEEWHLHPFVNAAQRRRERECLNYIRIALKLGIPINWESRYH